ncbi:hypothetical protein [Candidatus Clavichlamydia salmonicola]|uniref:hypothetical protein n=1 Tax=Candidatus Clavichlamydia salmonicola TaxID=469812 RepID=UPI0018912A39|nr:hypothetical protein [Candidatus Clavichlamydia salmonicola]
MKSEKLKKLESELWDLEEWMKLDLVPKKDLERHLDEINVIKIRIKEEQERLQFLKENGEIEEYVAPRRSPAKTVYPENPSMSDMDFSEPQETEMEMESETIEPDVGDDDREDAGDHDSDDDDDDPFSDRNRWKRGGIIDPDANEW